jgi:hypothetical protein
MEYTCPYCNQPTTITGPNTDSRWEQIRIAASHIKEKDKLGIFYEAIACPNTKCKQLSLIIKLTETLRDEYNNEKIGKTRQFWQLLPDSAAKPQPDYIPTAIVNDYDEACRIRDLSPKASATLARRCLQGMIRDFWGIKKARLVEEIAELEDKVSPEVWSSVDAVRSVGNIGAHMEKDVNIIVDIEPGEADLLIKLIEDLFDDWYVTRHNRQERQRQIQALAKSKRADKLKD